MSRPSSGLAWIVALTMGAFGWSSSAWLLWQHKRSQESQTGLHRMLEDQRAVHDLAERRLKVWNGEMSRRIAELERENDAFVKAHGELKAIEEHQREASDQLVAMETKKRATEAATVMLALRLEVMRSRYAVSDVASPGERQRRKIPSAWSQSTAKHAFREGLYAFASLEVSSPEREGVGGTSVTRQAAYARPADDRPTSASMRSIKAAFERADAPSEPLRKTDWAEAQFELGQALAAKGRQRSGTRELKEAVLAFRAVLGEWGSGTASRKSALVQFEFGRTLALLSRRSSDPSIRQESIVVLGEALSALVQAGESSSAAEAERLLGELEEIGNVGGSPK